VKSASLVVRVTINGKRKNLSFEQAKQMGVSGTFYMRTFLLKPSIGWQEEEVPLR
jgi:hypothetical protein